MLKIWDVFGSYFSSFFNFNFVFQFSPHLSVRIWWFFEMLKAFKLFYIWEFSDCPWFGYTCEIFEKNTTYVGQKIENFDEKMSFAKSIKNQSGMVPGSPGHEKTSIWIHWKLPEPWKTWQNPKKIINSKIDQENEEIRYQDHDLDLFWVLLDSFHFSFDHTWLRTDRLKSNYLTCWKFEMSSVLMTLRADRLKSNTSRCWILGESSPPRWFF